MVLALVPIEWIALILGLTGSAVGGFALYVTMHNSQKLLELELKQHSALCELDTKTKDVESPNTD